jgi:ubiquinone/menaquinone biosynthesis C-methylase UbiE
MSQSMLDRSSLRGQRVYDQWAKHKFVYRVVDRLTRSLRRQAVQELQLGLGDTAVDLGCGPGDSFSLLSRAVGPDGAVIGVDYSSEMIDSAAERAETTPPAYALRGDAATLPIHDNTVDGVIASLALSAMPDLEAVLDEIVRIMRPDAKLAVVDGQVPNGVAGTAMERLYHRLVNFSNPNLLKALRSRFESVVVVETVDAGLGFIARAEVG